MTEMRRILRIASVLVALLALAVAVPATANAAPSLAYSATTFSPSMGSFFIDAAWDLPTAKAYAYNRCLRAALHDGHYRKDCQGLVWVQNANVAFAATWPDRTGATGRYAWGVGWSSQDPGDNSFATAEWYAMKYCNQAKVRYHLHTNCRIWGWHEGDYHPGLPVLAGTWH
jgi:hypothetical protein